MADLIAGGRIVDCILILMLLEAAFLLVLNRTQGRGIQPAELLLKLAAGAALLLALRAALTHEAWTAISAWLLISLGAHIGELRLRWRAARP